MTAVTTSERASKRSGWQGRGLLLTLLSDALDGWDLVSGRKMMESILVTEVKISLHALFVLIKKI